MAALRGITDQNELNNIKEEITDLRAKNMKCLYLMDIILII